MEIYCENNDRRRYTEIYFQKLSSNIKAVTLTKLMLENIDKQSSNLLKT